MNIVEKTINAGPKKDAVDRICSLTARLGFISPVTLSDARSFIKRFLAGEEKAIRLANAIQAKYDEVEREDTIKYLLNRMPLDILDSEIADLQGNINAWADKVKEDPQYYLSWGEDAYRNAAKLKVYQTIRVWLSKTEGYDSPTFWSTIQELIARTALQQASSMASSTSHTSNLMQSRITEAWAYAASEGFSIINTISFWFHEKEKVGLKIGQKEGE